MAKVICNINKEHFYKLDIKVDGFGMLLVHDAQLVDQANFEDKCLKLIIDSECYGVQYLHTRDIPIEFKSSSFAEYYNVKPFKPLQTGLTRVTQRPTNYKAENSLHSEDGEMIPLVDFSIYQRNDEWVLEVIISPDGFEWNEI